MVVGSKSIELTDNVERSFYGSLAWERVAWRGRPGDRPGFAAQAERARWLVQRDGAALAPLALPELPPDADRATFLAATDQLRRPVVVRGFGRDTAAVRGWSPQGLLDRVGDREVAVGLYDQASRDAPWDAGITMEQMSLAQFFDTLDEGCRYLNNSTELLASCTRLLEDLDLDAVAKAFCGDRGVWDELLATNLFVGGKGTGAHLHAAFGGNFFVQVAGRKKWVLLDPRYAAHVHAVPGRPFQYVTAATGSYWRSDRSPAHRLPRYEVELQPGDLLYNAPWWLHEVDNVDAFTVGCALRHFPRPGEASPSWANHPLFTALSTYPSSRLAMWAHRAAGTVGLAGPSMQAWANQRMVDMLYRSMSRFR